MFVELIYVKRNMDGVPNANALILAELKVNAQQHQYRRQQGAEGGSGRNSEEMFEDASNWQSF